jgi:hypothetical protein
LSLAISRVVAVLLAIERFVEPLGLSWYSNLLVIEL